MPDPDSPPPNRAAGLRHGALRWMVGSMLGGYTIGTAAPSAKFDETIKKAFAPDPPTKPQKD